ncbi:hypothetical protein D1831_12480 [Lactiplantibacillus garii]|uniref:Uncharacterized protein n=1 Tax=Lactiplantibacillus garii TaxID=2306423 RepID=A0A426D4E5_9LACO|nr:hypothetical protein [Lactiplantibacillus garii]RRK09486.1 hypothetical protein D1831_12480 [Lactiplantibacillus garii]
MVHQLDFGGRQLIKNIAEQLEFSLSRLPIIKGDAELIPLGAVSRHSTSWIGAQQLTGMGALQTGTELTFCHRLKLSVDKSYYQLSRQVNEAHKIHEVLVSELQAQYQYLFSKTFETGQQPVLMAAKRQMIFEFMAKMLKSRGYPVIPSEINLDIDRYFGKLE